ncbi:MAG: glutathione-dependent reductase [Kordiimonadales bacterium]|nr:MAG: glutathione-dependent reductase [Kordiimonadales bacterium]
MIYRSLKGLEKFITVSVVGKTMLENGWTFDQADGSTGDALFNSEFLHQLYTGADAAYSGRVTVPVLWDKRLQTIVSNESADIIRMFGSAFDGIGATKLDLLPDGKLEQIEALNAEIYPAINNGVYRAGFATTSEAYTEAVTSLFEKLDELDGKLEDQRYLTGSQITEVDIRLFTTLVRFDPVYVGHFKCNIQRIADYANLSAYVRDIYQIPGVKETVHMDHIKTHYYASHGTINPTGIVPLGPLVDYSTPHDRGRFVSGKAA